MPEGFRKSGNLIISRNELNAIRSLPDFDLMMLISEIHDFGWIHPKHGAKIGGKALLPMILNSLERGKSSENEDIKQDKRSGKRH